MLEEVNAAVSFLAKMMQSTGRVSKDCLEQFKNTLEGRLFNYYDGHWFPELPHKGSAYRCIRINHIMDPLLDSAAKESGITNLLRLFPNEFTMWVDPFDVSYRIGENGSIGQLYAGDQRQQQMPQQSSPQKSTPDLTINSYLENQRSSNGLNGMFSSCKDQLREFASSKHSHYSVLTPFAAFVSG